MPTFEKKRRITRGDITANQDYLAKWDDYQIECINAKKTPVFLPISVDIVDGIMERNRIIVPTVATIMSSAGSLARAPGVETAVNSYKEFFFKDDSQSGTPPTPLDFYVNCEVMHLFYLPRENWKFTDHTQFSVDNIPPGKMKDAYEVMGVFDNGRALLVRNKNWTPENDDKFRAKYNLHVSIFQNNLGDDMRTDIIIDPGSNSNSGTGWGGGNEGD